jgi:Ca2+-binding EF-hand superfamily protein
MVDQAASKAASDQFARVSDQFKAAYQFATKGHSALRVMNLVAGLALAFGAGFSIVPDVVMPAHFVLDVYLLIFGVIIAITEARISMFTRSFSQKIKSGLGFLNSVYGRGFFYVGVGALALSHFWNPLFKCAGFALFVLGFVNVIVGRGANKALDEVNSKVTSEEAALKLFELYDVDNNNKLSKEELGQLVQSLSSPLSPAQLEAAVRVMDSNQDGTVDQQEFMAWWAGKQAIAPTVVTTGMTGGDAQSIAAQITISAVTDTVKSVRDGPQTLHILYMLAGLALAGVAAWQAFSDFTGLSPSKVVIDLYLCFFGVMILLLEEKSLACSAAAAVRLQTEARFLESAKQRGCFYVFVGSLAFVQSSWHFVAVGAVLLVIGVAGLFFGHQASQQLHDLRQKMVNETEVRQKFDECAHAPAGSTEKSLNVIDLAILTKSLGVQLNHGQLMAAHDILDTDNNGVVTFDEFLVWWKNAKFDQFNQQMGIEIPAASSPLRADALSASPAPNTAAESPLRPDVLPATSMGSFI